MKQMTFLLIALLAALPAIAADDPAETAAARAAAAKRTRDAAVTVAYTLQLVPGGNDRIAPQIRYDLTRGYRSDYSDFIESESPAIFTGFLVAPDEILVYDALIPDENIASIAILRDGESISARIERVYLDHAVLRLRLERPLAGAKPLGPDPDAGTPAFAASLLAQPRASAPSPRLAAHVEPFEEPGAEDVWNDGIPVPADAIHGGEALFDREGRCAGFAFGNAPVSAGRDPAAWRSIPRAEIAAICDRARRDTEAFTRPVRLVFRSAQKDGPRRRRYRFNDDENDLTELKTIGRFAAPGRMLVDLEAGDEDAEPAIPRLEKIQVTLVDGSIVEAEFVCVLRTARFLVAALPDGVETPLPKFHAGEPADLVDGLLVHTAAIPAGVGRLTVYALPVRSLEIETGWRGVACADGPFMITASDALFTPDGGLVWQGATLLLKQDSVGESRYRRDDEDVLLPAATFAAFASPAEADIAPVRPVSKEEEGIYGWIGLELQAIDDELADAMNLVEETEGGEFGAIVSRVHEGSSAAAAGVQPDWVLLTIRAAGDPAPRKVKVDDDEGFGGEFPWERLGEVPPQYFDRIPVPWPSVTSDFTTELRRIGIGAKIEAEFLVNGQKTVKEIAIEKGPAHYGNAPSFKWADGGVTVCDLTFEVREYLALAEDAPGVVVKRIESGAKAAVAGLRPFEVVTSVNGTPIRDVKGFEAAVTEGDPADFRMEVLRMDKTRVVQFAK